MPFLKTQSVSVNTKVYFWQMSEDVETLTALCRDMGIDTDFVETFGSVQRKKEKLATRLLLNKVFGKNPKLEYKETGAPYLVDEDINISISHSKDLCALAVNSEEELGMDIEKVASRVLKVRSKYLSEKEMADVAEDDIEANTISWTAKEALFKVIPENEIDFVGHVHIDMSGSIKDINHFPAWETRSEFRRRYDVYFCIVDGFAMSVATEIRK